eukprot:Gb_07324 [translate_table: standard]
MPPFQIQSSMTMAPPPLSKSTTVNKTININVGGRIFQTSFESLKHSDAGSLLASVTPYGLPKEEPFFDRDPELFAVLLSLLRTGRLPSKSRNFHIDDIIDEASFYGLQTFLRAAMASPKLDGLNLQKTRSLVPNGRDPPSAISAASDGSLLVGHGSKISVYDWALRKESTILTQFNVIDSIHRISPVHAVAGAVDFPGVQVYNTSKGTHEATLLWTADPSEIRLYEPTVQAVTSSPNVVFASFESGRKNANTILLFDKESLRPMGEMGRQVGMINSASYSMAATKLEWLSGHNLLLASAVNGGAFGYCGEMRLWDIRSGNYVWEWSESNSQRDESDCFADVVANEDLHGIFKVNMRPGGIAMADLRQLNVENQWMCLEDSNTRPRGEGGAGNRVLSYGRQVFCSRGGDLEVWCELGLKEREQIFRRNFVGKAGRDGERIRQMVAAGDRLFVSRKEMQGIEVWEST